MYLFAQKYAIAHPDAPPITIPHQTPEDPKPSVNANKYANTEMNRTSLITVRVNDVIPLPIAWNIELAVIPSGTTIKNRHITCRNAAIDGAIEALWDEYANMLAILDANKYVIVPVAAAIITPSFAE